MGRKWEWTDERLRALTRCAGEDLSDTAAAARMGCTTDALKRKAQELGLMFRPHILWSQARIEKLNALLFAGASRAAMARQLGVTSHQLSSRISRMNARDKVTSFGIAHSVIAAANSVKDASLREICEAVAYDPSAVYAVMRAAKINKTSRCACSYDTKRVARMRASIRDLK
jgi:hypothetical protein